MAEGSAKLVTPKPGISSKVAPMNVKSPINTMNMVGKIDHPVPSTSRGLILLSNHCSKSDERADNRKNENTEKKKKEEKLKQKAEKDARKVFDFKKKNIVPRNDINKTFTGRETLSERRGAACETISKGRKEEGKARS